MRLRGPTARGMRHVVISLMLAMPTCLCRQISGTDIEDGGQTGVEDAGEDASLDGGVDGAGDAGIDAGPDAGILDSGAGLCGPVSDLASSVVYPLGSISFTFASADINGDGLLDLIEAGVDPSPSDGGFNVLFGLADGGLSAPSFYQIAYSALAVGDINGDGVPDLLVSNALDGTDGITIFLNDGGGALIRQPFLPTSDFVAVFNLAIGDVNGDGRADLVVAGNDEESALVAVLFRLPDGGFSAPGMVTGIAPARFYGGLLVADLNGDGLADLVTNTVDQSHLAVLLSQSDGGFETTLYDIPALGRILLLPSSGDMPDIVLGETGFEDNIFWSVLGVGVMRNLGDGQFAEPRTYTISGGYDVAIGDFNGDCIPDIASPASPGVCQAGWFVSVLYGDADGGFTGPVNLNATGEGPASIAVLGPVGNPRAIAVGDSCGAGVTVYGDASRH